MRQSVFVSRIQEKVTWLSAVAVKNHGLLLNKHPLHHYKRATIGLGAANARTRVSCAAAADFCFSELLYYLPPQQSQQEM